MPGFAVMFKAGNNWYACTGVGDTARQIFPPAPARGQNLRRDLFLGGKAPPDVGVANHVCLGWDGRPVGISWVLAWSVAVASYHAVTGRPGGKTLADTASQANARATVPGLPVIRTSQLPPRPFVGADHISTNAASGTGRLACVTKSCIALPRAGRICHRCLCEWIHRYVPLSLPPDGSDGILVAANSAYTAAVRKIVIGTWPALARCLGIRSPETARRFVATTGLGAPALAALAIMGCRATNLPGVAASIRDDMAAHCFPQLVLARRFLWKNPDVATAIATTGLWTTEDLRYTPGKDGGGALFRTTDCTAASVVENPLIAFAAGLIDTTIPGRLVPPAPRLPDRRVIADTEMLGALVALVGLAASPDSAPAITISHTFCPPDAATDVGDAPMPLYRRTDAGTDDRVPVVVVINGADPVDHRLVAPVPAGRDSRSQMVLHVNNSPLMTPYTLARIARGGWGAIVFHGPLPEAFPTGLAGCFGGGVPMTVGIVWMVLVRMGRDRDRFPTVVCEEGVSPSPSFPGLAHGILGVTRAQRCEGECADCPQGTTFVDIAVGSTILGRDVPPCVIAALGPRNTTADDVASAVEVWLDLVDATDAPGVPRKKRRLEGTIAAPPPAPGSEGSNDIEGDTDVVPENI